jgi:hypothetical protein
LAAMDLEYLIVPKNDVRDVKRLLQKEVNKVSAADELQSFEKKLKDLED